MLPLFNAAMSGIGSFEDRPTLAIAVSGGIDSMALLLLADDWAKAHNGRVIALTVDHGLRVESTDEARQVKHWCKTRNIEQHTLVWNSPDVTSAIQAQARDARYALLTDWCKSHHILHLLTAHHQGDQAETLFFRLARGSAIDGLAAMPQISVKNGVRLVRPLLSVPKSTLENFLREQNQPWAHDASNDKTYYTRNLIRTQLTPELCEQAANLSERMGALRHHLETETVCRMASACEIFPQGYAALLEKPFQQMEPGYALRMLSSLLQTVSGESYAPRTEKLERLYEEIKSGAVKTRRSFSGCILHYQFKKSRFLISREAKAQGADVILKPDETGVWDKRFTISYTTPDATLTKLSIGALGNAHSKELKNHLKSIGFPAENKPVLPLLPSFWNLEQLVCVPHIGYTDVNWRHTQCHAQFTPAKALAGQAFSSKNANNEILRRKAINHAQLQ